MSTVLAARPRWATPASGRPSFIDEACQVAGWLGLTLSPWQMDTLAVALEHNPDKRLHYREILFTMPRQSGKSTWLMVYLVWRATFHADRFHPQRMAYTAQSGKDAANKVLDDWVGVWRDSAYPLVEKVRLAGGNQQVTFTSESRLNVLSSSSDSGHGSVFDVGLLDEAMKDVDDRREQAMLPAMMTRKDPQLIICSTAGTADAFYLKRKVETGRALVESGEDSPIAYFEWSAPDDCDADDEDVWYSTMPGLDVITPIDAVRHARRSMQDGEFRRAYLNQWTSTMEAAIPWGIYLSRCGPDITPSGPIHVAVDCTPDRSAACIAIASRVDGGIALELVECRDGLEWLLPELLRRSEQRRPESITLQTSGPLGGLDYDLSKAGLDVQGLTQPQMAVSAAWFHDAIIDGTVGIRTNTDVDAAVQGARKVTMGDSFRWARRSAVTNLAPLVAVSMAGWSAHTSSGGPLWLHP